MTKLMSDNNLDIDMAKVEQETLDILLWQERGKVLDYLTGNRKEILSAIEVIISKLK